MESSDFIIVILSLLEVQEISEQNTMSKKNLLNETIFF